MENESVNQKFLFQILDMSISSAHMLDESLRNSLQQNTAEDIVIGFIIKNQTDNIREIFSPYTDDQIISYFTHFFIARLNALPLDQKNPFFIFEKKNISINYFALISQLQKISEKGITLFILPNMDDIYLVINEDKAKPFYKVTKLIKRIKQFILPKKFG